LPSLTRAMNSAHAPHLRMSVASGSADMRIITCSPRVAIMTQLPPSHRDATRHVGSPAEAAGELSSVALTFRDATPRQPSGDTVEVA